LIHRIGAAARLSWHASIVSVGDVETRPRRRVSRAVRFALILAAILLLLFGVPWWTLVARATTGRRRSSSPARSSSPPALVLFPLLMVGGHGRRHRDGAARVADTTLGVVWVLFVWSRARQVLTLALLGGRRRGAGSLPHRRRRWSR
jgi:hypothetical protein